MRKYQPIWNKLKSEGKCTISVPPVLHHRVKEAVYKEKYKDVAFKIEWDIKGEGQQPVIKCCADKKNINLLRFELINPVLLGDLT